VRRSETFGEAADEEDEEEDIGCGWKGMMSA